MEKEKQCTDKTCNVFSSCKRPTLLQSDNVYSKKFDGMCYTSQGRCKVTKYNFYMKR
mgnify:CR=1 FL=1